MDELARTEAETIDAGLPAPPALALRADTLDRLTAIGALRPGTAAEQVVDPRDKHRCDAEKQRAKRRRASLEGPAEVVCELQQCDDLCPDGKGDQQ